MSADSLVVCMFFYTVGARSSVIVLILLYLFLHDYYLYDWHAPGRSFRWHGFRHPAIASRLAQKDFHLNDRECGMIRTHMFPLTLFAVPQSREAWLLSLADKIAALEETFAGWRARVTGVSKDRLNEKKRKRFLTGRIG